MYEHWSHLGNNPQANVTRLDDYLVIASWTRIKCGTQVLTLGLLLFGCWPGEALILVCKSFWTSDNISVLSALGSLLTSGF